MWKNIIDKDLIVIDPQVDSKSDLFKGMVDHVYTHDYLINSKKFLNELKKREKIANTELMPGVAFPHARSEVVEKLFLTIIILKNGIDYDNPDMGKVKIVFFLGCAENQNKEYLQPLAKSSRLLRDEQFRKKLIACESKDEVYNLMLGYEDEEETEDIENNYLMILTLHHSEQIPEVLEAMVEVGITNSSIVESISMARKMAYEMPIFAGLSYMAHGKSSNSSLLFAYIEKRKQAEKLLKVLKQYKIDLNEKGVGFIQVIRLEQVLGNFDEDIEF